MSTNDKYISAAILKLVFTTFLLLVLPACDSNDDTIITPEPLQLLIGADDGVVGRELLISDGTADGTSLLVDINTVSNSDPKHLVVMGGVTYFVATDGKTGFELWRTNGDTFEQVMDIYEGEASSDPSNLTVVGDSLLYFTANNGINGEELWVSDGDPNGTTRMVSDINPLEDAGSYPSSLTAVGSILYFAAYDATHGNELWRYDGTTAEVIDIFPGTGSSFPSNLTVMGNTLYFSADNGIDGVELWKSDGTAAGTQLVKDIAAGIATWGLPNPSQPSNLVAMDNILYFSAYNGIDGRELWKSDGTEAGTVQIKDIFVGEDWSFPVGLTAVGSMLYFSATDGVSGRELWQSDGSADGTQLVKDINTQTGAISGFALSSEPRNLTAVGTTLFFSADNGISGRELWKSDAAGTVQVVDIFAGVRSSSPSYFTAVGDTLYFSADNGIDGIELWKSSAAGTALVDDINPGEAGSNPQYLSALNDTVVHFAAHNGTDGNEIWQSGGTPETTALIADITKIGGDSNPSLMITIDGMSYFTANDGTNTEIDRALWRTDGTVAGTVLVKNTNINNLTAMGGTLYFSTHDDTYGYELWKSDGTTEGTQLVKDIYAGTNLYGFPNSSAPLGLTVVGSTLYFMANDGVTGSELWKSDGTAEGTQLVKDIYVGTEPTYGAPYSSYPTNLTAVGSLLYFSTDNGSDGAGLWKSDGTAEGTQLVKGINVGTNLIYEYPLGLTLVDSTLYFRANDGVTGFELWKSDGTTEGTQLVKDIYVGTVPTYGAPYSSYPAKLTAVDATLYFTAYDGTHGEELWKSDGTAEGTQLVKDIYAGAFRSVFPYFIPPSSLTYFNGALYFTAQDGITGVELWKSDGTTEGTVQVKDIYAGVDSGYPRNLVAVGDTLYFSADDGVIGSELWQTDGAITELVTDINPILGAGSSPAVLMHNR